MDSKGKSRNCGYEDEKAIAVRKYMTPNERRYFLALLVDTIFIIDSSNPPLRLSNGSKNCGAAHESMMELSGLA